ncbi:hypothetical protein [Lichenicoccus sp.]|uniref:hypothetical protein n=1 Tax=Lichenicoccus sp. TaxID=2781899 RepID=UPI003D120010
MNGELGVLPDDVASFLRICKQDEVEVLGWELWVVDHTWGAEMHEPVPAFGLWCGGIPLQNEPFPAIVGGTGDLEDTLKQLSAFDFEAEVQPSWLPYVRINFTLAD